MSIEQTIRGRHQFQDRLRSFLTVASVMTDREIEIALGRLADLISAADQREHSMVKGGILKSYYDLRQSGGKKHRALKRMTFGSVTGLNKWDPRTTLSFSDHVINGIVQFPLLEPGQQLNSDEVWGKTVMALAP